MSSPQDTGTHDKQKKTNPQTKSNKHSSTSSGTHSPAGNVAGRSSGRKDKNLALAPKPSGISKMKPSAKASDPRSVQLASESYLGRSSESSKVEGIFTQASHRQQTSTQEKSPLDRGHMMSYSPPVQLTSNVNSSEAYRSMTHNDSWQSHNSLEHLTNWDPASYSINSLAGVTQGHDSPSHLSGPDTFTSTANIGHPGYHTYSGLPVPSDHTVHTRHAEYGVAHDLSRVVISPHEQHRSSHPQPRTRPPEQSQTGVVGPYNWNVQQVTHHPQPLPHMPPHHYTASNSAQHMDGALTSNYASRQASNPSQTTDETRAESSSPNHLLAIFTGSLNDVHKKFFENLRTKVIDTNAEDTLRVTEIFTFDWMKRFTEYGNPLKGRDREEFGEFRQIAETLTDYGPGVYCMFRNDFMKALQDAENWVGELNRLHSLLQTRVDLFKLENEEMERTNRKPIHSGSRLMMRSEQIQNLIILYFSMLQLCLGRKTETEQ